MTVARTSALPLGTALDAARTSRGVSLRDLSHDGPLLVTCLRHFGCTFCRQALADLRASRSAIEATGTRIVLVHMSPVRAASAFLARYDLADVDHVSDPERRLYRALDLERGSFRQLLSPRVWWSGAAALLRGHRPGRLAGDGFQMPGAFLEHRGRIVRSFRHRTAAERPDYCALAAS
jgi:peroxiredoxin